MFKKHTSRIGLMVVIGLLSISITQCSSEKTSSTTQQKIVEPFEKVKIEIKTLTVSAEEGGEIKLENGTKITVPKNAFVDAEGNVVKGEVNLKYREFHSAVDIMLSGIPMKMTDNGKEYDFESAGMFEINGESNGKEVAIAKDKSINVEMASFKSEENYNHYYFDETKGEWSELEKTPKPAANPDKKDSTEVAVELKAEKKKLVQPIAPKKFNKNGTVLNLNVDYNKYPYLKEFNGVVWQYVGTDPKNDPKNNTWIHKKKWSSLELDLIDPANSVFLLNITAGKKKYTANVSPVLSGAALKRAVAKYQKSLAEYNTKQAAIQRQIVQQQEVYAKQASLLRSFQVKQFGIYNCDRYRGTEGLFTLNWNVEFENGADNSQTIIYHVCKTDNTLIQFWAGKDQFLYDPNKENVLLAVLADDKVAIFDRTDFDRIKKTGVSSGSNYTFKFRDVETKVTSAEDIDALIAGI